MNITLTPQQMRLLDAESKDRPRVVDPRSNAAYVLVPEAEYETIREVLEDERQQRAICEVALQNAIDRMNENP
ncbi:MAG: hypothetical protein AB7I48_28805 [Planctomycetaceae bacterium]